MHGRTIFFGFFTKPLLLIRNEITGGILKSFMDICSEFRISIDL